MGGTIEIVDSQDGVGANAWFSLPTGIATDSAGNLYITDSADNIVRKGVPAGPPVITIQPAAKAVVLGTSAQFSVNAGGAPPPVYQWYLNYSAIDGATASSLTINNLRASDAGNYSVTVSNSLGSITSSQAMLTVSTKSSNGGSAGGGSTSPAFAITLLALGWLSRRRRRRAG